MWSSVIIKSGTGFFFVVGGLTAQAGTGANAVATEPHQRPLATLTLRVTGCSKTLLTASFAAALTVRRVQY
jgi:hypothetical protein